MTPKPQALPSIQAARGAAALMVVIYHAERLTSLPQYVGRLPLGGLAGFGHAGVDFFFVLSGFIIHYVHCGDIGRPDRLARYAGRRISRIYPPYWAATAIMIAAALLLHAGDAVLGWRLFFTSVVLLPSDPQPILGVGWTLQHEALFYVAFGLAIVHRWAGLGVMLAWTAAVLFVPFDGSAASLTVLAPFNLLFAFGMAASWFVQRSAPRHPLAWLALGTAAFLAAGLCEVAGLIPPTGWQGRMAYGLCSTALVIGCAARDLRRGAPVPPVLVGLGAMSYSLYLVHVPVIGFATKLLAAAGVVRWAPGWAVMAAVAAVGCAAGWVFHIVAERRLTDAARLITTRLSAAGRSRARAGLP